MTRTHNLIGIDVRGLPLNQPYLIIKIECSFPNYFCIIIMCFPVIKRESNATGVCSRNSRNLLPIFMKMQ